VVGISAVPPAQSRLVEFAPVTFLQKPFAIEALLRAVEHAAQKVPHHETLDHSAL
jgi:hypothetical protein